MPSSIVLSELRGVVNHELQTYPKGFCIAEQGFQRRVQIPAVLQPTDRRAGQPRALRQVRQAQSPPLAQLAEPDGQGAKLDVLGLRDEFVEFASVDQLVRAEP